MPEMTAHKVGDPSFLHACAVEPSYKLHHDLRTKPAKKIIILDPCFTANIPVAVPGDAPRELAPHTPPPPPPGQPHRHYFWTKLRPKELKENLFEMPPPRIISGSG